jgi:cysteine-rich repeat protein
MIFGRKLESLCTMIFGRKDECFNFYGKHVWVNKMKRTQMIFVVILFAGSLWACGNNAVNPGYCGDGVVGNDEQCDDGNNEDGDGCSADCVLEHEPQCPDDMVLIEADADLGVLQPFCIDLYEASRPDATATEMGTDTSLAVSQPAVIPWHVNPMTADAFETFKAACAAAGKRICEKTEWFSVCTGPQRTLYVWGDTFDRTTCNCVDSFCEQYCQQHPEIQNCDTGTNCGYTYDSFHVTPTGQFADCVADSGAYDICGNVWEIVPSYDDARGYEVRGGAFNCAGAQQRLQCTFNASWSALYAGFRCCKDPSRSVDSFHNPSISHNPQLARSNPIP